MDKTEPIIAEIQRSMIEDSLDPIPLIISILRDAGIPVKGTLSFRGVESGYISISENIDKCCMKYTWTP